MINYDTAVPEDFGIDSTADDFQPKEWEKAIKFAKGLQYLKTEGFIEMEEDNDGEIRLYPAS